jgi:TPR repeat protein
MPRVELRKLLTRIVDKWSLDYLQRAKLGETEAMVQVAEIMFTKNGWGQIAYNPQQARRWLELAASKGDQFAVHALHNISKLLKQRHEEAMRTSRYAVNSLESPKLGFDVEKKLAEMTGNTHRSSPLNQEPFLKANTGRVPKNGAGGQGFDV